MPGDEAVLHVRIARDESFDRRRVGGTPDEGRAVGGLGVGAREDELAAGVRFARETEVLVAVLPAPLEVVGGVVVEEEEMLHERSGYRDHRGTDEKKMVEL